MTATKTKFGSLLILLQGILLILFIVFVDYGEDFNTGNKKSNDFEKKFPAFQNLNIMAFLGFGLIGTFLRRYTRGMLVHAFLIGGLVIQWATLLQGFPLMKNSKVELSLDLMMKADYAVVAVLISFGALVGKANSLQFLIIALIETLFYTANQEICTRVLAVTDHGRSIIVHLFGAMFGIGVARMIYSRKICMSQALSTSNKSEMFSLLGTIFLWVYWPSLNASDAEVPARQRAIANTYYALAASCISTFSLTVLTNKESRFNVLHLQNASIAGGVAIGAVSTLMVRPWGSIIIGVVGALSSVMGYKYVLPKLRRSLKIHDVRGINAAHGIPAIVSGVASVVAACVATEESYGTSLYQIYPARSPLSNTTQYKKLLMINEKILPGDARSGYMQGLYQLAGIVVTFIISLVGGLVAGLIIRMNFFEPVSMHDAFDDHNDFQEANCIDICSDDEYEDDYVKHHDSVRGDKRLFDTDNNSGIIASNETPYAVPKHYGELTPDTFRKSNQSLGNRGTPDRGSIPSFSKTSTHSIENIDGDNNNKPLENGIELIERNDNKPLIVKQDDEETTA